MTIHTDRSIKFDVAEIALVILLLSAWYIVMILANPSPGAGLSLARAKILGIFTFGDLLSLIVVVLVGIAVFDIFQGFSPMITSFVERGHKGKRDINVAELVKRVISISILATAWLILLPTVQSLAYVLRSLINPSFTLVVYYVLLGVGTGYNIICVITRSRAPRPREPATSPDASWSEFGDAVRMSRYLKRLEEIGISGQIDEKTYARLRAEYEEKLRSAIEAGG